MASVEFVGKSVQACLPHLPVSGHPIVQLAKWIGAQSIESSPALRADHHELRILQNRELTGNARLTNFDHFHQLADRTLAVPKRLHQAAAGRVGQHLEDIGHGRDITTATYFVSTIYGC